MPQYQDTKRHDIMLFTLHSLQLQRHSGGLGRGNGWRGMQPCIGSEGSEGLPPASLVHDQAASVTHLPVEMLEGIKSSFQNGGSHKSKYEKIKERENKRMKCVHPPSCHY